jgi:chemotaxis methyl-accepting protein methylase/nitrate/nitrite-specific signal transduction histidine kinase/PAS domain-containing protein
MSSAQKRKKSRAAASGPRNQKLAAAASSDWQEPASAEPGRLIVGIGASAGGLEALKKFFTAMPPTTGLVFVVVVHLDPSHKSYMAELLGHVTGLAVEEAHDRQPLEIDHVYLIPPNRTLTIDQGMIRVQEVADRRGLRGSIDHFFRSLAESERERAIAIVLSGTGTEGTLGARAIKAEGGLVIAQLPDTATQPGMPGSVISAGGADAILAPEKMPEALLDYVRKRTALQAETRPLEGLPKILTLLRARTKYDFRGYKTGTLQRRIERRMGLQRIEHLNDYADFLRSHPLEVDRLFKDLLIGVTSFFRDPAAFDELATTALAELVKRRDPDSPIRIWVPGCSTGEEAYSIAIVAAEQLALAQSPGRVQIFATDIDADALEVARAGSYPESITLDVTPQRLQRFFVLEDHRYTIAKSMRESVVFAVQNLTSDPPFSNLDLLSCRNVLIYLQEEMQEKLLTLFHFALNRGGYLFLGSAEGVGPREELFVPLSKRHRVFRRVGPAARPPLELPASTLTATDAERLGTRAAREPPVTAIADRRLLEHFAPAAVVVRSNGQIVRLYGTLERFMKLPSGEATLNVLTLTRDALKSTLRAALHEAVRRNRATMLETLDGRHARRPALLRISVKPLNAPQRVERLWLIIFEQVPPPSPAPAAGSKLQRESALVQKLETELRATKREQQHLIEQLEGGNEELQAANEEVLSMNEELQSTNEELTTSKEELQSMNEELTTLNAQLQDKVLELTTLNDDLANLLASTDIATVFLDTELRIKRFTTAASLVLNLQPADAGRPLNHIASNLTDVDLTSEARTVMHTLTPIERELAARDGKRYILRGLPYRTREKQVLGVVLTLVDVTTLKRAERDLREARELVSADLRRMTRLHALGEHLARSGEAREMLEEILRAALDITAAEMGILQQGDAAGKLTITAQLGFDPPFLEYFARIDGSDSAGSDAMSSRKRVLVEDVATSPLFATARSRQVLLAAGVHGLQSTPLIDRSGAFLGVLSTHYRTAHRFEEAELRWLDLLARHATEELLRQQTETALRQSRAQLEQRVADRTRWLTLLHEISLRINEAPTWDAALQQLLNHLCAMEEWQLGYVYLPDPDAPDVIVPAITHLREERFRPFHEASARQRYARGQPLPGLVYGSGKALWAADADELLRYMPLRASLARQAGLRAGLALPIIVGQEVIAVLELLSDHAHPRSEWLENLMPAVSDQINRVLERERATARTADAVLHEQQDLLHTLHDALGQTLTGLGMLSSGLRQRLAKGDDEAANLASEIAAQAQHALEQVRQLSRSLFPIEIEPASLTAALRELAQATESLYRIEVRVDGDLPKANIDGGTATQLYRIAQEAVTNAVKHARAHGIIVRVDSQPGTVRMQIADDGIGIGNIAPRDGVGLQIMRYRAHSIGGILTIERGSPGGTVVTCTLRAAPGRAKSAPDPGAQPPGGTH